MHKSNNIYVENLRTSLSGGNVWVSLCTHKFVTIEKKIISMKYILHEALMHCI